MEDNATTDISTEYRVGQSGSKIIIPNNWLVLDLGSGHNPHKRANILIDRYPKDNIERSDKSIMIDLNKPFIIADAQFLPFKDKCFDYIIASHIAEHVESPELFCRELMRVAKRGYIETPSKIGEKILTERFHKWYVSATNSGLIFERKTNNKPISIKFYRFFYFDTSRIGYKKLTVKNKFMHKILRLSSGIIRIAWQTAKRVNYTCFEWNCNFKYIVK